MITIDFTYQTVTPESAEAGDFSDQGFIMPGLHKFDTANYERIKWTLGDLSGLISFARSLGITHDGDSFQSVDPDHNYQTGESTTYGMHIAGASLATELRIARLLT